MGVGVGVGVVPGGCAQDLPPVVEVKLPPQMIISLPVQTAVCCSRALGALVVLVAVQAISAGIVSPASVQKHCCRYLRPRRSSRCRSKPLCGRYRAAGALVVLVAAQLSGRDYSARQC